MVLREATLPLYRRVSRRLADAIASGELREGDRVPSERALGEELRVSRATVRRALAELEHEGLVEVRGRVPVVAGPQLDAPANELMGDSEYARSRGLRPSARVLAQRVRPATLDEAQTFRIAPGAELLELRRARAFDGLPFALDENLVPLRLLPDGREIDFTTASLYASLDAHGERPARADYEVVARLVEPDEAGPLELGSGAPVLCASTTCFDASGRVLDRGRTVYRADRYRFTATLERR